jgi:ubiquinone/menaquinone biosynthesis C-methylase UbiE
MTNKRIKNHFDYCSGQYDSDIILGSLGLRFLNRKEIDFTVNKIKLSNIGEMILDLGVGTGRISSELVKKGVSITGVDLSKEMIRRSHKKIGNKNIFLVVADAEHLPFTNNIFNHVISIRVLHYVDNWQEAISEISRVTKNEGRVIIEVNGSFSISILARLTGFMKANLFNPFKVIHELQSCGLNLISLSPLIRLPILFYKNTNSSLGLRIIRIIESFLSFLPTYLLAGKFFAISKKVK